MSGIYRVLVAALLLAPAAAPGQNASAPARDEARREMEQKLAEYRRQTGEAVDAWKSAFAAHEAVLRPLEARMAEVWNLLASKGRSQSLDALIGSGKDLCAQIEEVQRESDAVAVHAVDRAKACAAAMDDAQARAAACNGPAAAAAINAGLDAAARAAAAVERDLAQLQRYRDVLGRHLEAQAPLARRHAELAAEITSFITRATALFNEVAATTLPDISQPPLRIEEIATKVEEEAARYAEQFPDAKERWDMLISWHRGEKLRIGEALGRGDAFQRDRERLTRYFDAIKRANYPASRAFPACGDAARLQTLLDRASVEADMARLKLFLTEDLRARAAACRQAGAAPAPAPASPAAPAQDRPQPEPMNLLGPPSAAAAPPAGGIFIKGPATIAPGQAVVYTATDGEGNPYTSGVQWTSSSEDVLVVGGSGGRAVALKKGSAVIIAYHPTAGRNAFLNVTVDGSAQPDAAPEPARSGFEVLGADTRRVEEPAPGQERSADPANSVRDFFGGAPPPPADLDAARREEQEIRRAEEAGQARREQQQRERDQAALGLLGVMSGMHQSMEDLRNRGRRPSAPPVQPTPAGPAAVGAMSEAAAAAGRVPGMAAPSQTARPQASAAEAPVNEPEKRAVADLVRAAYTRDWYPRWCPERVGTYNSGCAIRPMGGRDELLNMIRSARTHAQLDRVRRLLPCYANCLTAHAKNDRASGACITQCRMTIR